MKLGHESEVVLTFKTLLILIGVILLKILEVVILEIFIHWLLKRPLNKLEEMISIIIVFFILTPFTFIAWKQRSQAQEAEQRYRVLADHSSVGIYTYYDGQFQYVNRRFLEKTGYTSEEIIGHDFQKLIVTEDQPILLQSIQQKFQSQADSVLQLRAIKKDQSIMDIEIFGTVNIRNGKPIFMGSILDISERKRNEKLLNELAFCDPLTGTANRRLFESNLGKLIAEDGKTGQTSAVLFLDLDEFKSVNDCFGHEAGDFLLVEMANRISHCIRKDDTVARIAGDEFMILLVDTEKNSVIKIAKRIIEEINKPVTIEGKQVFISGSLGISYFPEHGTDPKALIRYADKAMYEAKKQGKNSFYIYSHKVNE